MEQTKDDVQNSISTGDTIMKQHGFKMTVPALVNWPEDKETKFLLADEVKEIGEQIVEKFRDDLRNVTIGYVFRKKAPKSDDSITMGQAKTESELQKVLHGLDAIVIIGHDVWKDLEGDAKFRLVYHELEHFQINFETGVLKTVSHPVEEFPSVIKVFGPGQTSHVDFIYAYNEFSKNHNNG